MARGGVKTPHPFEEHIVADEYQGQGDRGCTRLRLRAGRTIARFAPLDTHSLNYITSTIFNLS